MHCNERLIIITNDIYRERIYIETQNLSKSCNFEKKENWIGSTKICSCQIELKHCMSGHKPFLATAK